MASLFVGPHGGNIHVWGPLLWFCRARFQAPQAPSDNRGLGSSVRPSLFETPILGMVSSESSRQAPNVRGVLRFKRSKVHGEAGLEIERRIGFQRDLEV